MNKLNSKNWQRVRISHKNKTLTFTNDTTYKTMTECDKDIKSTQYMAINLKRLNDLVSEGYVVANTNSQETIKNVTMESIQSENVKDVKQPWQPMYIVGDEQLEKQIAEYTNKKMQKKGIQFVINKGVKDGLTDAEKQFLSTPPKQPKHEPLKVDKYSLTDKQYHSNVNAVKRQREDYCNL